MSKTIAVHVRYKSLYISLPSAARKKREMTCLFYALSTERGRRWLIFRIPIWN